VQHNRYYAIALCTMLILCGWVGADETERETADNEDGMPYVGEVIIKYRSDTEVTPAQIEDLAVIIVSYLQSASDDSNIPLDDVIVSADNQPIGNVSFSIKNDLSYIIPGLVLVSVSGTIPLDTVIALLETSPLIEYVEPNYLFSLVSSE